MFGGEQMFGERVFGWFGLVIYQKDIAHDCVGRPLLPYTRRCKGQGAQSPTNKGENMTRKDYEKIAGVIMTHRKFDSGNGSATIASIADSIAAVLSADNPRFDSARFFLACGLSEDGGEWVI